jgi:hypothetical protein
VKYLKYKVEVQFADINGIDDNRWYFSSLKNDILTEFYLFDPRNDPNTKFFKEVFNTYAYSEQLGKEAKEWRIIEDSIEWISDCSTLELIKEQFPEYFI